MVFVVSPFVYLKWWWPNNHVWFTKSKAEFNANRIGLFNLLSLGMFINTHKTLFRTEMCTFLFWIMYCGIWDQSILGFEIRFSLFSRLSYLYCWSIYVGDLQTTRGQWFLFILSVKLPVLLVHLCQWPAQGWLHPRWRPAWSPGSTWQCSASCIHPSPPHSQTNQH